MNETNKLMATQIFEWLDFTVDIIEILQFIGDLRELVDAILQALGGNFQPLGDWIEAFVEDPWPGFEWLSALGDWTSLTNIFEPLGAVGEAIGGVVDTILDVINAIISAIRRVPVVGGAVAGRMEEMKGDVTALADTADEAHENAGLAQITADAALGQATTAISQSSAAQTAASNAANAAAQALETADIAYENAQYWKDEFSVSSAGVYLGKNEEVLGMFMDVPPGKVRKITAVNYLLQSNTGTINIQLIKRNAAGVETVIHTSTVPSAATRYRDNSIDYTVSDTDTIMCNITAIGGAATALHCALIGVLIDA